MRKTKAKFRWLALLLAMVSLFGVLAIPASADYYYAMKVSVYYKDESGKTLAPTYTTTVNATTTTLSVPSPAVSGYLLKNDNDASVPYSRMEKRFPASNYVREGSASYTVYYVKASTVCISYAYFDRSGRPSESKMLTGKVGSSYSVVSPTITGFTPSVSCVTGTFQDTSAGKTVYYYENTYQISYDANGGSGAPATQTKKHFTDLTLSKITPTRSGYTFKGWSTVRNGSVVYAPGSVLSANGNRILYAVWNEKTCTISFDANGGTGAPGSINKRYSAPATIPFTEPTRSGYVFRGWSPYSTASSAMYLPGDCYRSNVSRVLYAVWEKIPETYTVSYSANGGTGAPATQTKTENIDLTLSSVIPTRKGYTFLGWSKNGSGQADYQPGANYSVNESMTLSAVWEVHTYVITFHPNGGKNAPGSATKTYGNDLILPAGVPTRDRYDFLGWSINPKATAPTWAAGGVYTEEGDATLYAVWRERYYDFSVLDLTVTPDTAKQFESVSVRFRLDNWDRYNAYSGIPVSVWIGDKEIYSTTVNFVAYGVNHVTFSLACGGLEGEQTLTVWVNQADYRNEKRTGNNTASAAFTVERVVETNVEPVSGAGEFYAGEEVVTSFYIGNEGMTDIYPSDNLRADFVVYTVIDGRETALVSAKWEQVVVPANGTNLVWFKWRVPDKAVGRMCWVQCRINSDHLADERNPDNNSREFAILPQVRSPYRTPNTRYEEKAPADYRPDAKRPASKSASATWTQWVYENGAFVLKKYGIRASLTRPSLTPDASCTTATKVNGIWEMKSGYGVNLRLRGTMNAVSGVPMAPVSSYTGIQNVTALFPEYGYEAVDGRAETLVSVGNDYQFVGNADAGGARVHFIPLYHRDGSYRVVLKTGGIWTPAGYLESVRLSNEIVISGTVYDDWYNK